MNLFEVLSRLLEHLLLIPLTGFGLDTLLIVVYPTIDCTRLVTVHVLVNWLPIFSRDIHR